MWSDLVVLTFEYLKITKRFVKVDTAGLKYIPLASIDY